MSWFGSNMPSRARPVQGFRGMIKVGGTIVGDGPLAAPASARSRRGGRKSISMDTGRFEVLQCTIPQNLPFTGLQSKSNPPINRASTERGRSSDDFAKTTASHRGRRTRWRQQDRTDGSSSASAWATRSTWQPSPTTSTPKRMPAFWSRPARLRPIGSWASRPAGARIPQSARTPRLISRPSPRCVGASLISISSSSNRAATTSPQPFRPSSPISRSTSSMSRAERKSRARATPVSLGRTYSSSNKIDLVPYVGASLDVMARDAARRRQVALNVKIVDVNLSNANLMNNSLSFKVGDGFLSVDKGAAVYNYGGYNPATNAQTLNSPTTGQAVTPAVAAKPAVAATFDSQNNQLTPFIPATLAQAGVNAAIAEVAQYTYGLPTNSQIPTKFLSTLQAQIISGNGKILTDPTLVVQEGQKSTVNLTQDVFGGFKVNSVAGTGATTSTREPIIKQAGLSLEILVNRIDDNGFVSVGVAPTVSSIGSTINTADGDIALLQSRTLNSGEIRLRDGQTLILSGIIQESDRTSVTKVPILGDIPILGALFRSTNKTNQRQEVVVLLTPQILNDNRGQVNYAPGVDARLMIGK